MTLAIRILDYIAEVDNIACWRTDDALGIRNDVLERPRA